MPPVRKQSNLRCFAAFCFVQWRREPLPDGIRANKINEPAVLLPLRFIVFLNFYRLALPTLPPCSFQPLPTV